MEDWGQVHNSVQFRDFLEIRELPNINRRLIITNNHIWFHSWQRKSLVKQKNF